MEHKEKMKRFRVIAGSSLIPEDAAMMKESSGVQALPSSPSCMASRLHIKDSNGIKAHQYVV